MEPTSPYTPPQTEVLVEREQPYGRIRILSPGGRIGRLRYVAYSFAVTLLAYLMMAALMGLVTVLVPMDQTGLFATDLVVLFYGVVSVFVVLLTIQRCHDFNASGWLSLLLLLPLVPIFFWFIPGTRGANRFGPQPPPNRGAVLIIALLFVIIMVLGILAAIAIPVYNEYVARAAGGG